MPAQIEQDYRNDISYIVKNRLTNPRISACGFAAGRSCEKYRLDALVLRPSLSTGLPYCVFYYIELERIKQALFKSIVVKKYQYQKNQGSIPDDKENILNRDFKADTVFKKLVTDITYIHIVNEWWTYLASVMVLTEHSLSSSMK